MNDMITARNTSTRWIESLAIEELNMHEHNVINWHEARNIDILVEEGSLRLMEFFRDRFEYLSLKFNEHRGKNDPTSLIKIFKISNTVNDFMLFRNALKLIVSRKAIDSISIGLITNTGSTLTKTLDEIKAHVGPFEHVSWRYEGEVIYPEAVVKHYLTEFIRHSAR